MNIEDRQNQIKQISTISDSSIAFLTQDKYTMNKELDNEYKNLTNPVGNRLKNAFFYNTCIVFGFYYFSRNIVYFRKKKGISNITYSKLLRTTFFYTFIPVVLLMPNLFILFGLHPIKYFREKKAVEEKLLGSSELRDSLFGFTKMYKNDIASSMFESEESVKK